MNEGFIVENGLDLQAYLTRGVEQIVKDAVKATLRNPRESIYMAKFAAASKAASKKREHAELTRAGRLP